MAETLADRVRECRKALNLNQAAAAERSGVSPKTIQLIEQGRNTNPVLSTVEALAAGLGCSVSYLLGLNGDAEPRAAARETEADLARTA